MTIDFRSGNGFLSNLNKMKIGVRRVGTNNVGKEIFLARSIFNPEINCNYIQENDGGYTCFNGFLGNMSMSITDLNILFFKMRLETLCSIQGSVIYMGGDKEIIIHLTQLRNTINLLYDSELLLEIEIRFYKNKTFIMIQPNKFSKDINYDDIALSLNEFDRYNGRRNIFNRIFTKSKFKFISD